MSESEHVYNYSSLEHLKFELMVRSSIVNAAKQLNNSRFSFAVFRRSRCNEAYWKRTREGGFLLKSGASPAQAIADIYSNSGQYATECSTAIVIIYYKALLDVFPVEDFNRMFSNIYLMNWQHIDSDFGLRNYSAYERYMPGDLRYFKNPDVNPLTPEWQGENAIDFGNGLYYGHGIGIMGADEIINALNRNRVRGSVRSAYLMDSSTRLNFYNLYRYYARSQRRVS